VKEADLQRAAAQFLMLCAPAGEVTWRHVPNGGLRAPRTAGFLKASGVKAGVADFHLTLRGGRTAWIELKTATGRQSPEQRAFQAAEEAIGALYAVVRSLDELEATLRLWGVQLRTRARAA
jgi:hypothetical protein